MDKNIRLKVSILKHIWVEDIGMSVMLCMVIVANFILQPIFNNSVATRFINEGLFLFITISGIWSMLEGKNVKIISTLVPAAYVVFAILDFYSDHFTYNYIKLLLVIGTFIILVLLILKRVFDKRPVNNYKIIGALLVFLLMANLCSVIFDTLDKSIPNAFSFSNPELKAKNMHNTFLYFSYTTITTTGYGDVTPLHPFARSLVILEQLFGIFYPILLIGRLVSLNISNSDKNQLQ